MNATENDRTKVCRAEKIEFTIALVLAALMIWMMAK
jgi:hypothetical protein